MNLKKLIALHSICCYKASVLSKAYADKNWHSFLQTTPIYLYRRVTRVAYLGQEQQLIRVKNCSGPLHINWVGAWNPKDTRWANVPESVKKELDAETHQDGGFWMAYGDFLKYFKVYTSI